MRQIQIINLEWNDWNGFIFNILSIETMKMEAALFGISFSSGYFYLDIFFKTIKIYDTFKD